MYDAFKLEEFDLRIGASLDVITTPEGAGWSPTIHPHHLKDHHLKLFIAHKWTVKELMHSIATNTVNSHPLCTALDVTPSQARKRMSPRAWRLLMHMDILTLRKFDDLVHVPSPNQTN